MIFRLVIREMTTGAPVQLPSAAWPTMLLTRLPAGAVISYVKHRPDTCGNRPLAAGIVETPFSRNALISVPVTVPVTETFWNGSTPSTEPRVIGKGGGVMPSGQNPPSPASGHVIAARSPPEFVIAKSVPYVVRSASVTTFPTSDSQSRPSERPH